MYKIIPDYNDLTIDFVVDNEILTIKAYDYDSPRELIKNLISKGDDFFSSKIECFNESIVHECIDIAHEMFEIIDNLNK